MWREAQAACGSFGRVVQSFGANAALALLCLLPLAACASGGAVLDEAEVDSSILTASTGAEVAGSAEASDALTIRNAVSSANLAGLAGGQLAWANVDTGSQGMISGISEYKSQGSPCRRFTASREAFDGVALFKGDACLAENGQWRMRSFESL